MNNRKYIFIVLFFILLVTFSCGCCNKNVASNEVVSKEPSIILKIANGIVEVKVDGNFKAAVKGQNLAAGNVVKVGNDGLAVIQYPGKYEVFVDKNSEVSIKSIKPSKKKGFFGTVFHLFKGMIYSKVTIDTKQGDSYQVETDHVVAGVHGTEFLVTADPDNKESAVYVEEGTVKTRGILSRDDDIDDKAEMIDKYEMTTIKQDSVPLPPSSYNPAKPPFSTFWKKVEDVDITNNGSQNY
ncbi:FecR domain-containing protein [bacterium]|nr:FecR domain-containing protein [bacterium]